MIVLIGFMGAGKSTTGALLAQMLGKRFVDLDSFIENEKHRSISDIFVIEGEARFRRYELEALEALTKGPDVIIALGGGAPENESIQKLLEGHLVILLDVLLKEALDRIGNDPKRPMLKRTDLDEIYGRRSTIFHRLATIEISSHDKSPFAVVAEIIAALDER